jgi:menaquinone-9 beta-reductase
MQPSSDSQPAQDASYDVAVVGGGPGGSSCAAFCAMGGLRTVLIEREVFPREKVCGDCLNPSAWPVLQRLGVEDGVRALPLSPLREVEFVDAKGRAIRCPLPVNIRGEIGIRRSVLDALLLDNARCHGVHVCEKASVEKITREKGEWRIDAGAHRFSARTLVAADGRNSTVARLLGMLPAPGRDRVALQTHFPAPLDFGERVVMQFLPWGYSGLASVGEGILNLCLVARPRNIDALKAWATGNFQLRSEQPWRTVTPLSRDAVHPAREGLLLVGDAARVVEPFTGEGIYYALASGELAARHLLSGDLSGYAPAHARLYRGRLWVNGLARAACLHPSLASVILRTARLWPGILNWLTRKVVLHPG